VFLDMRWKDMNYLLLRIATMLEGWRLLCPMEKRQYFATSLNMLLSSKASKDWWLNLVPDEAARLLFQRAHCWEEGTPKELEPFRGQTKLWLSGKWLSLASW